MSSKTCLCSNGSEFLLWRAVCGVKSMNGLTWGTLTFVVVGSCLDGRPFQRRRRFFQAGPASRPTSSTSARAPPTSCRWPGGWGRVFSASGEPAGAPGPGGAWLLGPRPSDGDLSGREAPGWHREGGEAWRCRSSRAGQRGRAPSRPEEIDHVQTGHKVTGKVQPLTV